MTVADFEAGATVSVWVGDLVGDFVDFLLGAAVVLTLAISSVDFVSIKSARRLGFWLFL